MITLSKQGVCQIDIFVLFYIYLHTTYLYTYQYFNVIINNKLSKYKN